ncbi:hypothetical protein [Virgibacillus proomii]|uniref:hypothetical protein n=1 Tax=Virgibacillus proomii TaxID=84407 RepID=UPI001C0FAA76|nr:hypothetical protein [Virgibacillus proomii]MBU5265726.1 hypothetical protein [Virgibacillus proomii]
MEPGTGAKQFAKEYYGVTNEIDIITVLQKLNYEGLHSISVDNRMKKCVYCGYYWRDDSLRNTKKTCCEECHRGKKTLQRRKQRADKALTNPNKRTQKDDYISWLDYPFWIGESSMENVTANYEVSYSIDHIDYIYTKNRIYGEGNRKRVTENIDYDEMDYD